MNDDDHESVEMYINNTQSASSKRQDNSQKCLRGKQVKRNITNSIKRRRSVLNKIFIGGGDSLINVQGYNNYLKCLKRKCDDIITINVSGNRYQTRLSTLDNYPNTLLGNKNRRKYYWNNKDNEYFFDRHRHCFEAILYYYQSNGRLRRPDYVPLDTFLEEISFFDLGPQAISQINKLENVSIIKYIDLPNWFWRRYIWFYLEYPQNSIFGRIIHFISMFLTVISCITLAIETLPKYKEIQTNLCQNSTLSLNETSTCSEIFSSPFFIIQTISVSYFTIEFLLRLISTPSYWRFILSIFNWVDLGAILPYFIFLGLVLNEKQTDLDGDSIIGLKILRLLRFLRVFKIYLVFKQFKTLRVLSSTLKESFIDFIIMIIILTLMAFLFGSAVYFAEQDTNGSVFDSIPKATYWGILTITTVGYGDMYPITAVGRTIACICAFVGLATSGMLVSVLVDRYQRVYNRKKYFPEQIISTIVSSDDENENDEKQDFINRKLSGSKRNPFSGSNLPISLAPPLIFSKNYRKSFGHNHSSSYVRFIITLTDDQTVNEFMKQLTEIIQNTGDNIHLKLINAQNHSSNQRFLTTNQLSSIYEE